MAGMLANKRALIVGLASNRSIAAGIAQSFRDQGAELAFSYQNEKLKARVEDMAGKWGSNLVFPCDVGNDVEIEALFEQISATWDSIDIIVHSVGFAPSDQLEGDYLDCVNREGFKIAHDISSYSFAALAKAGRHLLEKAQGSLLTLSYYGAEKAVQNYNVMGLAKASLEANVRYLAASLGPKGVRVNGISAGPIKTLAASGIKSFRNMLKFHESHTPMRRNVTTTEVGNTAAFLCSDMASGITGEVIFVDGGYHAVSVLGE